MTASALPRTARSAPSLTTFPRSAPEKPSARDATRDSASTARVIARRTAFGCALIHVASGSAPSNRVRASARSAIDSNSVSFFEIDVGAAYDFTDWLGIQAGVRMLRSSALSLTSANALLTIRCP